MPTATITHPRAGRGLLLPPRWLLCVSSPPACPLSCGVASRCVVGLVAVGLGGLFRALPPCPETPESAKMNFLAVTVTRKACVFRESVLRSPQDHH